METKKVNVITDQTSELRILSMISLYSFSGPGGSCQQQLRRIYNSYLTRSKDSNYILNILFNIYGILPKQAQSTVHTTVTLVRTIQSCDKQRCTLMTLYVSMKSITMFDGLDQYNHFLHYDGFSLIKRKANALSSLSIKRKTGAFTMHLKYPSTGVSSKLHALYPIPLLISITPKSSSPLGISKSEAHFTCPSIRARTIDATGVKHSNILYISYLTLVCIC